VGGVRCILLDIYWNILTMHGPMNVKSPNNTSKWQMGCNSAFKGLIHFVYRDDLTSLTALNASLKTILFMSVTLPATW